MKNRVLSIVLVILMLTSAWCCCAENAEATVQFSGKYHDIDNEFTKLDIEKNEEGYSVLINIYRLIQLEFTAAESEGKLKGEESFEDAAVIGVEMTWDDDVLAAMIIQSSWDLLPVGTEFHFSPDQTNPE